MVKRGTTTVQAFPVHFHDTVSLRGVVLPGDHYVLVRLSLRDDLPSPWDSCVSHHSSRVDRDRYSSQQSPTPASPVDSGNYDPTGSCHGPRPGVFVSPEPPYLPTGSVRTHTCHDGGWVYPHVCVRVRCSTCVEIKVPTVVHPVSRHVGSSSSVWSCGWRGVGPDPPVPLVRSSVPGPVREPQPSVPPSPPDAPTPCPAPSRRSSRKIIRPDGPFLPVP